MKKPGGRAPRGFLFGAAVMPSSHRRRLIEAAEIAEYLLEKAGRMTGARRFPADQLDRASILLRIVLHMLDNPPIVEIDGEDLLVDDVLRKEGKLLGLSADVVPD